MEEARMNRTALWTWLLALSLLLPTVGAVYAQEGAETVTLSVEGMT
jgi:hypothetical protein